LTAAFVREHDHSVKILDAEAENLNPEQTAEKIANENPLLVNIVVMGMNPSASSTPKMTAVRETITALKKINSHIKIVLSGLHPSALPEKTLKEENVPFVCVGEGFNTILQLIEQLKSGENNYKINGLWYAENGEIKTNPPAVPIQNLDDLPFSAWDLLPMEKYRAHNWHCFEHINQRQPYAAIFTSIGCPFNCIYCNIHALYGGKPSIRFRSPEKVVEEIGYLVENYKVKNIKFLDELFAINESRVMRICDLINENGYDLNIWAYGRVDTVNERMLKHMKQAGINWICYGFESASEKVREGVSKKTGPDKTKNAIEMTRVANINILANFLFGLPDDNYETMQATLDMAKKYNFEYVNFYTAMAYPGSHLYEDAIDQGIKLPENWSGFGQYSPEALPLPTKYLSAAEVLQFRDKSFEEYFINPKYLKMIRERFGNEIEEHIKEMLKYKIKRKYA